jgi:hypothetical protein
MVSEVDRLTNLEIEMAGVKVEVRSVLGIQATTASQIADLYKLQRGRPSWPIASMLGFLSTGLGITITALVMQHAH